MSIDREERGGSRRSRLPHSRPDRGSLHGLALVPRGAVHVGLRHRAPDAAPPRGSHRRRVLPDPVRQRHSCSAARYARGPRGRGRPPRTAKSRDPETVPRPSDFTSERDAGPLCRLAGDEPMGADPEGSESHAVRHPGPALRPGCGLLRVPAPALELALWLADGVLVVSGLAVIAVYFCTRGIQVSPGAASISRRARGHLLGLAALLLLLKAVGYRLAMFDLLFSERGVAFGAGYSDVHAQLPVQKALLVLAGLVAVLCLVTIRLRSWRPLLWSVAALVGVAILGGVVYPGGVQPDPGSPHEIVKEKPYIDFNIRYTRLAYGLENIEERELPAEQTLTLQDLRKNEATLKNIRLWDTRPLLATYSQLQEIRTYYKFTDIDIDRYRINGEYRQVTLSPRELSAKDLPSRIWINERLTYTHGYGAVVSPVNRVTREGLPEFWVKDIPPVASSDLRISRPELYFSELATDYVFVKTHAKEFDYPSGDQNVYTTYAGQGGIPLASFWRKTLFASRLGDLKLLLSNDLTPGSRVLLYRNIRERVQRIAPFFRYDDDPYMVISAAGRIVWLLDGYTVSDRFPYSTRTRGLGNYVRNAVKVTVDAYDGTVHFYVADPADHLIRTTARIFPGLLQPLDAMPADLRAHLRYPEGLFRVQAGMYAVYHMRRTQGFYTKEGLWGVPVRPVDGQERAMEPYYLILRLPGEPKEEFVLLIPFNPSKKDNLSAWLAARSDPPHYGKLVVYNFPKQKLIYGPRQIEARIHQDSFISQQLSLWNQRGSQVIRGNLLVIPIERSLVYVEPLYIAAEKEIGRAHV